MSREHIKQAFNLAAKNYDKIKVRIIPKYREMEKLVLRYLSFPRSKRINILELGTGTGALAVQILNCFPQANYHGIDFSEKMLELASHRLRKFGQRVVLQNLDLNKRKFTNNSYDLIISLFAIHHIENKKRLFRHLYSILKPRGSLIFADVTISEDKNLEASFIKGWKDFMSRSDLTNKKIKMVIEDHRNNDLPETVETQMKYLKTAGFNSYDIIWRYEKFAVFYAVK